MDKSVSVYDLVTKLCRQLSLESNECHEINIKKYRALAFETLLKSREDYPNPLKELNYYIFERQVDACTLEEYEKCDELLRIYDEYEGLASSTDGILAFLLELRDSVPERTHRHDNFFPLNLKISCMGNPYMLQPSKTHFFTLAEVPVEQLTHPEPCEKFFVLNDDIGKECNENVMTVPEMIEIAESENASLDQTECYVNIEGLNWENLGELMAIF